MWLDSYKHDGTRRAFDAEQVSHYEYKNGPASDTGDGNSTLILYMKNSHTISLRGDSADEIETFLFHRLNPQLTNDSLDPIKESKQ